MSIEKEVNKLLAKFEHVYLNITERSILVSNHYVSLHKCLHINKINKSKLLDVLDDEVNLRWCYGFINEELVIEVYLGKNNQGVYFKDLQTLIPTTDGLAELLVELFEELR